VKVQTRDTAEFTPNKLYQNIRFQTERFQSQCWRRLYTKEPKTFLDQTSTFLVCRDIYLYLFITSFSLPDTI